MLTTIGRLALAVVFAVAAVGKLTDRPAVATAAEALGVPGPMARPAAALLPVIELGIASALVWGPTASVGAAAGLFLLTLLTGLVVLNLGHGRRPPCHCFGRVDDSPIGAPTVVRNLGLMALAVAVLLTA